MTRVNIDELLPHRGRMRLVDEVIRVDSHTAVTASVVSRKWPLFSQNGVSSIILVELMAQTAGICFGWKAHQKGGDVTEGMGWLVGIKKASFHRATLPVGRRIITKFEKGFDFENYHEVAGHSEMDGIPIGEVHLQIMEAETQSP